MSDVSRITITEDLTIYHALELKQRLLEGIEQASALELDLSHVAEIDTAGLQLLILVQRETAARGRPLTVTQMSNSVRETLDFCNLTQLFGDKAATAASPLA